MHPVHFYTGGGMPRQVIDSLGYACSNPQALAKGPGQDWQAVGWHIVTVETLGEATAASNACVLRGIGLSKAFGHVQALENADIEVRAGEVLALVGDNGAGKSTLIKILSGVCEPDSGTVEIDDHPVRLANPRMAYDLGVATVFQDLALVDFRDVASNVLLGREPTRFRFTIDRGRMERLAKSALNELRINIPSMDEEVANLSGGQRQAVAIARATSHKGKVVIMDEPTAALGVRESRQVLEVIARLRDSGLGVVVVSHNMLHVFAVADRIMVLSHGRCVGVRSKAATTPEDIVKLIVGVGAV